MKQGQTIVARLPLIYPSAWVSVMPTVLRADGFRVMIYFNDHRPAHVHVWYGDADARIELRPAVALTRINGSMSLSMAWRAVQLVKQHRNFLIGKWNEIHGTR